MFTPGSDNHTQKFTGQNTTSITESGTHSGGSGVRSPKVRNELIAIPPTTDISSHFQTSRTTNHLGIPKNGRGLSHARSRRFFHRGFSQELRSFFGRRWV